ncbi:Uncharacterised protein [Staphylococcus aureus]|uniref:Uncharacterized protein n=2 Tax=Staphylococcus TaxID=1279 RepID=A0A7Z7QXE6_STASC|nr:hypothetical protein CSC55_2659 [Staphylococcus aureus]EGS98574.1 hypothetical protein SA21195_0418 [Staphylococcus aureus subsp. aureus 21195]EHO88961.1 hypothetical protein SA21264_1941 [Staphylococcus aureus subsp. aureus 21264]EHQ70372.1 hypothetical protein SA21345_1302 [Staphylococcus aureus subsp. aureus 21345]EHT29665.1 hypothetical protein SACIG1214_1072 [Staphylococcus aureus subsp. aureus CIG1214]EHT32905.1 hypothetical protein SACIG1242_0387 [Staphylococcus aureus subsp. aureus 
MSKSVYKLDVGKLKKILNRQAQYHLWRMKLKMLIIII